MIRRVRRAVIAVAAVTVFVLLASATYQGVATALERRRFPHPGRLVPVGDHQLHIRCLGSGHVTVVLESSLAGTSSAWAHVQESVSATTRACAYDRSGMGWSEAGDLPYDPGRVAPELRTLLDNSGEPAPYLMVGQGLGAAYALLDAAQLGDRAGGLVLIDDPTADARRPGRNTTRLVAASPWLARAGILRAARMLSRTADGLPEPEGGAVRAFLNRPDHLTRSASELRRWNDVVRLASEAGAGMAIPTVRLTVAPGNAVSFFSNEEIAAGVTKEILALVARLRQDSPAP